MQQEQNGTAVKVTGENNVNSSGFITRNHENQKKMGQIIKLMRDNNVN
jgi:hypothetical protein